MIYEASVFSIVWRALSVDARCRICIIEIIENKRSALPVEYVEFCILHSWNDEYSWLLYTRGHRIVLNDHPIEN